ncbi:MAG: phosphotransferase family protein [Proteobacteria bacterium]|nr:phosphotransferase family protein [Desulfobacula sp.]MBU3952344.1 phosphotransferase family protein [Pseudomonadota bacterium]MBU4131157.1 phosphotransferase family protein [Pseudomonadota bacterium]
MQVTDTATTIRPGEEIDANAVKLFLKSQIKALDGDIQIRQFPSGFSNLTYLITAGDRQMVLRRPPIGANVKAGHDMGREFRVLEALYPVFPKCPRPLAFSEDESLIGAPFFVMEKLSGIILRKDLPMGLSFSPDQARRLCVNLVDTLADIHGIDVKGAGLDFIGKPEGYVKRQVDGWSSRYRKAKTDDAPDFEDVMAWLAAKMPEDTNRPAMVHNDYKLDNLVLDPDQPEQITGILDWEMATFGDPLMDLGNSLAYWVEKNDPQEMQMMRTMPTNMDGALTRQEILNRYAEKTGQDLGNFDFYYCFGLFRLAVIAQQIYNRYHQGITQNKRFAMLIFGVIGLEKTARRLMASSRL